MLAPGGDAMILLQIMVFSALFSWFFSMQFSRAVMKYVMDFIDKDLGEHMKQVTQITKDAIDRLK